MKDRTINEIIKQTELRGKNLDNWFIFSLGFIRLAAIGSYHFLKNKSEQKGDKFHNSLYIGIVFNIKHGIEILLKHLFVLLGENLKGKDKNNQYKIHDIKKIFEKLSEKLLEKIKKNNKEKEEIKKLLKNLEELVLKYQHCDFIKDKIGNDFEIEDFDNTAFKYPENNLNIKLDYSEILKKDEIISDIEMFLDDCGNLLTIFSKLSKYLSIKKQ